MASDEVGAAGEVREQYNHVKGNKLRWPCAILWHVKGAGKSAGTMCVYTATLDTPIKTMKTLTQQTTFANVLGLLSRTNRSVPVPS